MKLARTAGAACGAGQRRRSVYRVAVFAGLPQATWHIVMVSGAYFIFSLLWRGPTERKSQFRRRFAVACAAMAVCGLLLSAIQLLPAVELQQEGERSSIAYETFAELSMTPRSLLTLVFPFSLAAEIAALSRQRMGPLVAAQMGEWIRRYDWPVARAGGVVCGAQPA